MSKCKMCNNPTEWNPRRNKYNMYCSKKCANIFHSKKNSKRKPDYGLKTKQRLKEKQERQERFKWYSENWLTAPQVAELLGLGSFGAVYHRAKKADVQWQVVPGPKAPTSFFNPEDIEKLKLISFGRGICNKEDTSIPDGYLTAQQAAHYLGYDTEVYVGLASIGRGAFKKAMKEIPFIETKGFKGGLPVKYKLYLKKDLDEGYEKAIKTRALETAENKRLRSEATQKRREEKKRLEEKARKIATQGLIDSAEAAKRLGITSTSPHVTRGNLIPVKRIGKSWFNPADVEVLRQRLEKERQEREENGPYVKVITRNDNYTSVKAYEDKLFNIKIPKMLKSNPDQERLEAIALNNTYHNDRTQRGFIHKLKCGKCNKMLPYTSFGWASNKYRGRYSNCKVCISFDSKSKYNSNAQKQNWKAKTPKQKFRTIIGLDNIILTNLQISHNSFIQRFLRCSIMKTLY